jgi:(2S)-methylsuccinyl-CoA dehydrogenase
MPTLPTLEDADRLAGTAEEIVQRALDRAREITAGGAAIDDHQVLVEQVAYAATQGRAARETVSALRDAKGEGRATAMFEVTGSAGVALLARDVCARLEPFSDELGLAADFDAEVRGPARVAAHESVLREIGRHTCETRGREPWPLDELSEQVRDAVREFAEQEVAPKAEHIHRTDALVPESFISGMAELGYFGLAIPEQYGGSEMGNLAMILTTEELSRASLAAAGSLITRPEILTKALLQGGTEEQKAHWLPKLASGEVMVGISVTEPDIGSDVAGVKCRAERRGDHWVINGPKAWCTFAGRANVLALLARTVPDLAKGA